MQGSLLNAAKMRLSREQLQLDSRCVVLSPMTLCAHCSKRIAQHQVLVTSDSRVLHESCYDASPRDADVSVV